MGLRGTRAYFFLPPDPFRPSKYLEPCPSPRESLGAPRAGYLSYIDSGGGILRNRGWGFTTGWIGRSGDISSRETACNENFVLVVWQGPARTPYDPGSRPHSVAVCAGPRDRGDRAGGGNLADARVVAVPDVQVAGAIHRNAPCRNDTVISAWPQSVRP